jgi:hypothetical protein
MVGGAVVMAHTLRLRSFLLSGIRQVFCHRLLVELLGLPLDDRDGVLGAFTQAGAQPIAEVVGGEDRLAVNDPYGPFGAGRDTEPASVTSILIYPNDLSDHLSYSFDSNVNPVVR